MKIPAIILFILTYILLLSFPKKRAFFALLSGTLFILLGILPVSKVFTTVDWNVILMLFGTMGVVSLFIDSKMPALLGDILIDKTPNVKWAIISLSLFAGIVSAFIDNVATVLMIAPIALTIARRLNISPVPSIIAIAISSNLQGAATLVGDTTSILLGGYAGLDFFDFFFFKGKLGIFWIVQAGALAATLVLLYVFRNENQPITSNNKTKVNDYFPTFLLVAMVLGLILASFIPNKPKITNGIICIISLLIGLTKSFLTNWDARVFRKVFHDIDYFTILLLVGLFIVIGGITEAGIIEDISHLFVNFSKDNLFLIYTLIVWASVLFSAFIDNIPYVATMLPVVSGIASILDIPPIILYFGLLSGATLGGNLTPIGASANITALGILRKEGYDVSAKEFMKLGVPFTLTAVIVGYVMIWFIWS